MTEQTDRELLEMAAKAFGNGANSWSDSHKCLFTTHGPYPNEYRKWNPLADDGDALRLAVKCGIDIGDAQIKHYEKHSKDPYAATRRSITRAAAELGKAML